MRRPLCAAFLATLLLVSCSDGADDEATSGPRSAAGSPPVAVTPQQARALLIRADDLPNGWTSRPPEPRTEQYLQGVRDLAGCIGSANPDTAYAVQEAGDTYTQGAAVANSAVDVTRTMADYDRDVAAITGPKSEPCLGDSFKKRLALEGLTVDVAVERFEIAQHGDVSIGFHLTVRGTAKGQPLTIFGDVLHYGRSGVSLALVFLSAGKPFDASLQRSVVDRVTKRFDS